MAVFYLRTACVVYALALRMQHAFVGFQQVAASKEIIDRSMVEPSFPMVSSNAKTTRTQRYPVELLQHEGSPKVFKTVKVVQQEGLEIKIGWRCLFAYDVMMVSTTDGILFGSPQQAGLVCPCCNNNQQQWDLEHNIANRMSNTNQQQCAPS